MNNYNTSMNYSTCNEDSLTEIKALKISNRDVVICITGSGGRVLNLLTENPKKIIAIDINPVQNWLLQLKIAAIKNFSYQEYSRFLGITEEKNRLDLFDKLKHDLSQEGLLYWQTNKRYINKGVLYQGKLEKNARYFSDILKESMGSKIDKLFTFSNLKEQIKYYEENWVNDRNWHRLVDSYSSTIRKGDATYNLYVDATYDFKDFLLRVFDKAFRSHLIRENHFLGLIIDGSYKRVTKLPLCLREENFQLLKKAIDKVEIITSDLVDYLKTCNHEIDRFSISDIGGYLSSSEYENLYRFMIKASRKNARLCGRNIIAERSIPNKFSSMIIREEAMEKQLKAEDLSFEYEIIVGSFKAKSE
ncbi:DUF3419 family protein [Alkaliphilus pronyensis]|uniref:DUF3419 family protein n=1 Tax=Alkaliphilus pronyensis TaxID=1482732 RepID=A0A6I0F9Q4_9FIRM|nr:DUF3419 family protein [Alkaliphilus pronyensis]KAB3533476.1 DUF3419 family protein [Alkaliphilus pronyensis]